MCFTCFLLDQSARRLHSGYVVLQWVGGRVCVMCWLRESYPSSIYPYIHQSSLRRWCKEGEGGDEEGKVNGHRTRLLSGAVRGQTFSRFLDWVNALSMASYGVRSTLTSQKLLLECISEERGCAPLLSNIGGERQVGDGVPAPRPSSSSRACVRRWCGRFCSVIFPW